MAVCSDPVRVTVVFTLPGQGLARLNYSKEASLADFCVACDIKVLLLLCSLPPFALLIQIGGRRTARNPPSSCLAGPPARESRPWRPCSPVVWGLRKCSRPIPFGICCEIFRQKKTTRGNWNHLETQLHGQLCNTCLPAAYFLPRTTLGNCISLKSKTPQNIRRQNHRQKDCTNGVC